VEDGNIDLVKVITIIEGREIVAAPEIFGLEKLFSATYDIKIAIALQSEDLREDREPKLKKAFELYKPRYIDSAIKNFRDCYISQFRQFVLDCCVVAQAKTSIDSPLLNEKESKGFRT